MAQHLHPRAVKLLAVDVGNTSTAVGLWTGGRVRHVLHVDGDVAAVGAAIAGCAAFKAAEAVAYASVVPRKDRAFKALFRRMGLRVAVVGIDALGRGDFGFTVDYPKPLEIGADRLADAAGAVDRYGTSIMILDFGTAFTAAVVTRDRVWRGGVIAPGFPLVRDYFYEKTAKLPRLEIGNGRVPKIGRSTQEAMRFGAIVGYRGMVREIAAELTRNFKENFRIVATGGFARLALKDTGLDYTVDPDLTLYGTGLICAKSL